jgi:Protein of unknown function (DUF3134)
MADNFYNPALKEQPRKEPAPVIAVQRDTSILEWLEAQGRLIERDDKDSNFSALDERGFEDDNYQEEEDALDDGDDAADEV